MIGRTIALHRIVEKLGGSVGMAYKAEDVKVGRFLGFVPFMPT
jgi:hypothetical protein